MAKKNYKITILADDFAAGADSLIELLDKGLPTSFKTIFQKNEEEHSYRCYIDEAKPENCYGFVERCNADLEELLNSSLSSYSVKISSYNDDDSLFTGTLTVDMPEGTVTSKSAGIPADVQKAVDEKMKEGIRPELKGAVEARVKYMLRNYVNTLDIIDVVNYWDVSCINAQGARIPTYYIDPDLDNLHKQGKAGIVSRAIQSYLMGMPKILKGPKSTGKNTLINSIVWVFGDHSVEHTFSMQDSFTDVIASEGTDNSATERLKAVHANILADAEKVRIRHTSNPDMPYYTPEEDETLLAEALFKQLSAESASVHIVYEYRAFAKWLLDPTGHCCLIADEMNMGDANLLVALFHPILDGSMTEYAMPGRGNIPLAKHLMMFATCNIGYAGEQDANPATRSRFGAFELGQPKSIKPILHSAVEHDTAVKGITTKLPEDYFSQTEKFYSACRRAASSSDASITDQCLNIRGLVRALVMTSRFNGRLTLRQAIEDEVVTPCDDEERPQISMILDSTVSL